jgi:hypothetical protein
MEDELHKMIFDALPREKADTIWREIARREEDQRTMTEGAIRGWRSRVEELEADLKQAHADLEKYGHT